MINMYKILFINSTMMGTFIAISAHSWITAWIGLEINLLSLIPLLKNNNNKFPSESTIKYFIAQATGSSLILFTIMILLKNKDPLLIKLSPMQMAFMSSSLLLKMGAAPFHFWLPEVMSGLKWSSNFIMMTWQKMGPILLLSYMIKSYTIYFSIIIIISSMISGLQGLNQICLRKIMAYSSINHVSWMMSALLDSVNAWILYFAIYCIINMNILLVLNYYNVLQLSQLTNIFTMSKKTKFFFMLNFLSLGGLPPFIGFLPKWMVINNMINGKHYLLAGILIIFTLISLYLYLRITFSSFTVYSEESLIILFNKISYLHFLCNLFSLLGLFACSMIYTQM